MRKCELLKELTFFIVNPNAQPGKNSTVYKTHKPNIPVRIFITICNKKSSNICWKTLCKINWEHPGENKWFISPK